MNLLHFSLLSLPLAFAIPSPEPRTTCTTFHLENVTYASTLLYSTPAHLAVSTATFSIGHLIGSYSAQCTAYSSGQQYDAGFFAFPQIFTCSNDEEANGNVTFSWDRYAAGGSTLNVNQTWVDGE